MKLKTMYACVTRNRDSDSAYEVNEKKSEQNKKLQKASKRNSLRRNWYPLSKLPKSPSKTAPENPSKTPSSASPLPEPTISSAENVNKSNEVILSVLPSGVAGLSLTPTATSNRRSSQEQLFSPNKSFDAGNRFNSMPDTEHISCRDNSVWKSEYNNNAGFDSKNSLFGAFAPYARLSTGDLRSSQDDVFSETTPNWPSDTGANTWNKRSFESEDGDCTDDTAQLLKALNLTSIQQLKSRTANYIPLTESRRIIRDGDSFENLKNRIMWDFDESNEIIPFNDSSSVGVSTDSMSSLSSSSSSLVATSVDLASATFETARALCNSNGTGNVAWSRNSEHGRWRGAGVTFQGCSPSEAVRPRAQRCFSTSVSNKTVDWSDIPPLIPPREPVRPPRHTSLHRHSSTPSPTSSAPVIPTVSTSSTTSFSPLEHLTNSKPHYRSRSSTTPIFKPLPPSMTTSSPIILPIMRDGKQESFTHYYLLGDEKSIPKNLRPAKPKPEPLNGRARPKPSGRIESSVRANGPAPPRPPPSTGLLSRSSSDISEATLKRRTAPFLRSSTNTTLFLSDGSPTSISPRIGRSRTVPRFREKGPGQKIATLQSTVFGVTDEECKSALLLNSWDVSKAINYLKVEQLLRIGIIASRENCRQILQTSNWDLESASRLLLQQHENNLTTIA